MLCIPNIAGGKLFEGGQEYFIFFLSVY